MMRGAIWIGAGALAAGLAAAGAFVVLGARAEPAGGEYAHAGSCPRETAMLDGEAVIPGGAFRMGSDAFYPEEVPARQAEVAGFHMDRHEVTNARFAEFVAATGYVTVAERDPDPADYPGIDPAALVPGSAVFETPEDPGMMMGGMQGMPGWSFVPGASWRAPFGPGSDIDGMEDYPVVHVAYEDAAAYAEWAGRRLPAEAEWERAARAGLEDATYEWGQELAPEGAWRANTWQGPFPITDRGEDGFLGAAPVGCFEPSEYGLYDMTGNVWEWTADAWSGDPGLGVVKGGSYLCAANYCARYRPAARQGFERDFSASHIGFRTVAD